LTTSRTTLVSGYVYDEINETFKQEEQNVSTTIHNNLQNDIFSLSYFNTIGFLTTVSIYTLAAAGFDRLFAVYKPFAYNKAKTVMHAKIACVICWVLASVFSLIPIVAPTEEFRFGFSSSLIVEALLAGNFYYLIFIMVALTLVWIVNIMVYVIIKQHTRAFQQKFTESSQLKSYEVEKRLAATLCIMVS